RKARRVYSLASRLPGTNRLGFQPSMALSDRLGMKAFDSRYRFDEGIITMKVRLIHQGRDTTPTGQRVHVLKFGLDIGNVSAGQCVQRSLQGFGIVFIELTTINL
ncbi:MAG: hypothetical protein KZQ72_15010, partial [Candidatus Thiodiazotropha sp. (ex Cardiolucina cf. quadrata)]|nr:hypothetical protein [Candidatus Thiodiazotropha sp. (ex Cardiolucina cf. quadrata)]